MGIAVTDNLVLPTFVKDQVAYRSMLDDIVKENNLSALIDGPQAVSPKSVQEATIASLMTPSSENATPSVKVPAATFDTADVTSLEEQYNIFQFIISH